MTDKKKISKGAKKELKAQVKTRKKEAKLASAPSFASTSSPAPAKNAEPTPAERSAAAAERQARLHTYRVWLALIGVVLGLVTLLLTTRPRTRPAEEPAAEQTPPATKSPAAADRDAP